MTAPSGINQCIACNKQLYGIVAFCPYCGKQPDKNYTSSEETESFSGKDTSSPAYEKPEVFIQSDAAASEQGREEAFGGSGVSTSRPSDIIHHDPLHSEIVSPKPKKSSGIWKWIVLFILLVFLSLSACRLQNSSDKKTRFPRQQKRRPPPESEFRRSSPEFRRR